MDQGSFIIGNLTKDPEIRFTQGGMPVCSGSIAVNQRKQNKTTQEWEDDTSFFNFVAFGQLAENISDSCTKGARVILCGRFKQRTYTVNVDGVEQNRSAFDFIVDDAGPALKWATAQVVKNERRNGSAAQPAAATPAASAEHYAAMGEEPW